jgi:transposase InsO family protein
VDASSFAIGAVLSQRGDDGLLHPVAFYSATFTATERNYPIYDRELLAVRNSLVHWRVYLANSPHVTIIYTDHSNLLYWKDPHKISRRVAREFQDLSEYRFVLKHIAGTANSRADALSRRPDYSDGKDDNEDVIVLPSEVFVRSIMSMHDHDIHVQVVQGMEEAQVLPWVDHHNLTKINGLWHKDGALVVVGDNDLKRGVISFFHDSPSAGHPGIANTLALLRRDYWWPNMKRDVDEYVKGCATCQAIKTNTHRLKPHLFPISVDPDAQPFEVVAMDFIVKLPVSDGYDSILTITDHDCSKACILIPCNESITAEGVANLYLRHVYPHYGLPKRVISDRDTRFASKWMRELCRILEIKQNISSAYHPQTDGQSERTNQRAETLLRIFCNAKQDNWAKHLPIIQFALNSWPNATTKHSPFELIMGWIPRTTWINQPTTILSVEQRLEELGTIRQHAFDSIKHAQDLMATRGTSRFVPHKEGAMVWLEGTNLHTFYPTAKLAPKRYGPFRIKRVLSDVSYELELPAQWKIHPVIHANLLTPYKETELHGANFIRPPPDLIEGEEEYEVEKVLDAKRKGRGRKLHYLIQWHGFPISDSTWEPADHMTHSIDAIAEFYRQYPNAEGAPTAVLKTAHLVPQRLITCC